MEFKDLVGKTIVSAKQKILNGFDDKGYLELKFSDGSEAIIIAVYGDYTGNSVEAYPTNIDIVDIHFLILDDVNED
jgi:hypothetical protein